VLADFKVKGVAEATGAHFLSMPNDDAIESVMDEALAVSAEGTPVLVDVNIDYSRRTRLTKGVVRTNLGRFSTGEKVRFLGRAAKRHLFG
jgi:acetolactate synthase-1/2/3 large subunit